MLVLNECALVQLAAPSLEEISNGQTNARPNLYVCKWTMKLLLPPTSAAVLHISEAVAEGSYDLADQAEASRTFAQAMNQRYRNLTRNPQKGPTPAELRARMMRRGK